MKVKFSITIMLIGLLLFISGCSSKGENENLMKTPQLSKSQSQIQSLLKKDLPYGAKLINLNSGEYTKSIEYLDIDNDRVAEALVFFRQQDDEDFYNNKISCMVLKKTNNKWHKFCQMDLQGTSFENAIFKDIDNDGKKEIFLCYKTEGAFVKTISAYKLNGNGYKELLHQDYVDFILDDMDLDNIPELIIFNDIEETGTSKLNCALYKEQQGIISKTSQINIDGFGSFYTKTAMISESEKAILIKFNNDPINYFISVNKNTLKVNK